MAFKQDEKIMERIWDTLPKSPDSDHLTFVKEDIEQMWLTGFVDTEKYSMEDWVKVFEPHKTPENTYVLKKEDFLEKDKYRYTGEIFIPFEPLIINEGKYTDEGLQELIDMSIAPSCSKSHQEIKEFFEEFKDKHRGSDNLIQMDMRGKREIANLIYDNPSPRRRRELLFDALITQEAAAIAAGTSPVVKASPEQAAQVQTSTFTTLPSCRSEKASKELKTLEKSKAPQATGEGEEGVKLKKVKKSRKGFRG